MVKQRVGFLKEPFQYRITGSCICCGKPATRIVKLPYDQAVRFSQANSLFSEKAREITKCSACDSHGQRWEWHNDNA